MVRRHRSDCVSCAVGACTSRCLEPASDGWNARCSAGGPQSLLYSAPVLAMQLPVHSVQLVLPAELSGWFRDQVVAEDATHPLLPGHLLLPDNPPETFAALAVLSSTGRVTPGRLLSSSAVN